MSFAHSRRDALSNNAMSTRQGRVLCRHGTRATAIVPTYRARARALKPYEGRERTQNTSPERFRRRARVCARDRRRRDAKSPRGR